MKKLLLCSLFALHVYAAESQVHLSQGALSRTVSYLQEQVQGWDDQEKYGGPIAPSEFSQFGKAFLDAHISGWIQAVQDGNVPKDKGLAKIVLGMKDDGVEEVIKDKGALKKANGYLTSYESSASYKIERIIKDELTAGRRDNYCFGGAEEANTDRIRITRQHEFYNIMFKRHEALIMPQIGLVSCYHDQGHASERVVLLELNKDNNELSPSAIRGVALLAAYLYQNDQKQQ